MGQVLLMDGFEHGLLAALSSAGWSFNSGNTSITTTAGQVHKTTTGAGGARALQLGYQASSTTPTVATTVRFASFWKRDSVLPGGSAGVWISFQLSGTTQVAMRFNGNGTIELLRGGNNASLGVSVDLTTSLNAGAWMTVEFVAHATTGVFNLYLGSSVTPVLTYSGNTLTNGGVTTGWNRISFYGADAGGNSWLDDLILTDGSGTRMPEAFITLQTPTGAGVTAGGFTPTGAGSNAAATDDVPLQTAIYAGSVTVADEMTLAMADLPAGLTIVPNTPVKVTAYAARDGAITGVDLRVRNGGTDAYVVGAAIPSAGTFVLMSGLFAFDNAGNAWTNTSVNAIECGVRLT